MSLLEELLAGPGPQERYQQLSQLQALMGGGGPSTPGASSYGTPPGRGIFGNDEVDVLQAGDPRLRSVGGTTLARPAARSIIDVLRGLGLPVSNIGGGYRTATEQQAMLDRGAPAAPVGSSFHQEGLAIDLAAALQNQRVFNALEQAGWQQLRGEPWHWTYGTYG